MDRFQHYIDGTFEDAEEVFSSLDPATGHPWALMPAATPGDMDRAVRAAHRAFHAPEWAGLTGPVFNAQGTLPWDCGNERLISIHSTQP